MLVYARACGGLRLKTLSHQLKNSSTSLTEIRPRSQIQDSEIASLTSETALNIELCGGCELGVGRCHVHSALRRVFLF